MEVETAESHLRWSEVAAPVRQARDVRLGWGGWLSSVDKEATISDVV